MDLRCSFAIQPIFSFYPHTFLLAKSKLFCHKKAQRSILSSEWFPFAKMPFSAGLAFCRSQIMSLFHLSSSTSFLFPGSSKLPFLRKPMPLKMPGISQATSQHPICLISPTAMNVQLQVGWGSWKTGPYISVLNADFPPRNSPFSLQQRIYEEIVGEWCHKVIYVELQDQWNGPYFFS